MSSAHSFTPLIEILRGAGTSMPEGWLFLPDDRRWDLSTNGVIIDTDALDDTEIAEDETPLFAKQHGLVETLDGGTLESIYVCAARLEDPPSDGTLLEAFTYYYEFDAYLPKIGAPDPPSQEDVLQGIDREFYDSLGDERPDTPCKREGCDRGAVKLSVFCRKHHFENVKQKPCPFGD